MIAAERSISITPVLVVVGVWALYRIVRNLRHRLRDRRTAQLWLAEQRRERAERMNKTVAKLQQHIELGRMVDEVFANVATIYDQDAE